MKGFERGEDSQTFAEDRGRSFLVPTCGVRDDNEFELLVDLSTAVDMG